MPLEDFADRLQLTIRRLARAQLRQERDYLSRGLITLPQFRALYQVAEMGTCSMRALAKAQGLKASTVTGLVDRLVRLRLLKRGACSTDRRTVLVSITPKGHKIMQKWHTEHHRSILRLFQHISPQERAIYLEITEQIVAAFAPATNHPSTTPPAERKP